MRYTRRDRERWVREDPAHKRADRDDFARDRARLLHSAALRRLSAKTQVVQPDGDDFIRNRLTHSLEVAQIGREFGAALGCHADLVDTACLAHDLGHPPFGHHGEAVLDGLAAGIGGFEGNAQTLRVLTRLEPKRAHPGGRPAGLNLTRASLDAATKYPWARGEGPCDTAKFGVVCRRPAGIRVVPRGRPDRSTLPRGAGHGLVRRRRLLGARRRGRHRLGRLDPRAPSQPDRGRRSSPRWHARHTPRTSPTTSSSRRPGGWSAPASCRRRFAGTRTDLAALKDMTSQLIGRFLTAVEAATRTRHGPGPLTRFAADLVIPDEVRAECSMLKAVAAHYVMLSDERRSVIERQAEIVTGLVRAYSEQPHRLDPDLAGDFAAAPDDGARKRVVIDQVAALTDRRAIHLHQLWS